MVFRERSRSFNSLSVIMIPLPFNRLCVRPARAAGRVHAVKPKLGAERDMQAGGNLPVLEPGQHIPRDDGAFPVRERAQQPQQLALPYCYGFRRAFSRGGDALPKGFLRMDERCLPGAEP